MKNSLPSTLLVVLASLAGCASPSQQTAHDIDVEKAPLKEYSLAMPGRPLLAGYQFRLQKRIDQAFFEAIRSMFFAKQHLPGEGHAFAITLTVLSDGKIGASDEEIRLTLAQEPTLATAAFNALVVANERAEAFSEGLKKEVGQQFVYRARFAIR